MFQERHNSKNTNHGPATHPPTYTLFLTAPAKNPKDY